MTANDSSQSDEPATKRDARAPLDLGRLYWNTDEWKTYVPYKREDRLVYMVTVRREAEVTDAVTNGLLEPHDERMADSNFDRQSGYDSYRTLAADEAERIRDEEETDDAE